MNEARTQIAAMIEESAWARVAAGEWQALRRAFPEIPEAALRRHLEALGCPIEQPWRGIDTKSLEGLEASLHAMTAAYRTHPWEARAAVIGAKDKARFAARNPKAASEKRAIKAEMADWMLVWLGDPAMFADWAKLRRAYLSNPAANPAKPIQP